MINEAAASVSLEGIAAGVRAVDTMIKAQLADVFAQRRSIEVAFDYLDVGEVAIAQSLAHDRATGPGIVRVCRTERWGGALPSSRLQPRTLLRQ